MSSGQGRPESPVYSNLQELKITQSTQPPVPSGSPLHVVGDWETHKDQNGRHFYYNRATQERTWKPPRTRDNSTRNLQGESHSTGESSEVNAIYRSGGSWSIASIGNTFGLPFPEPCALVSRCITLSFNKQWHSLVNKYENITLDWYIILDA